MEGWIKKMYIYIHVYICINLFIYIHTHALLCDEILLNHEKEGNPVICDNMDGP